MFRKNMQLILPLALGMGIGLLQVHSTYAQGGASQQSVDALEAKLDVGLSAGASQQSVDALEAKLDVGLSAGASQQSVDALEAKLDVGLSAGASQQSVDALQVKVDALEAKLDVGLSGGASQQSVDALETKLDVGLSGGASQQSVDALEAKLDVGLSTGASQESVDALEAKLDQRAGAEDLSVRLHIEHALSRKEDKNHLVTLLLPEEFGGLLGRVQEIVTEAIMNVEFAGFDTKKAVRELHRGDEKFADGDFGKAFDHYQKAYRAAAKLHKINARHDDDDDHDLRIGG